MTISVIMSVYNGENYLKKSIKSILDQSFRDFEFLIIDDGSNDRSAKIIEDFAKLDSRISFFSQKNIGLTKSLNQLALMSKNEFIARIDADDVSERNRLLEQFKFLSKNHNYSIVGSNANLISEHGKFIKRTNLFKSNFFLKKRLSFSNTFIHSSIMFRKSKFLEAGKYDESFIYAQDYDLWLRMSVLKDSKFKNFKKSLVNLRVHKNSISHNEKSLQNLCAMYASYRFKNKSRKSFNKNNINNLISGDKFFLKIQNRYLFLNQDIDGLYMQLKRKFIFESFSLYLLLMILKIKKNK